MIARLLLAVVLCSGCLLAKRTPKEGEGQSTEVAANGTEGAETGQKKDKLVCRKERVTGSHFKKRVCRYESDREAERTATQSQMRRMGVGSASPPVE